MEQTVDEFGETKYEDLADDSDEGYDVDDSYDDGNSDQY